jgi:hypothetical protein
MIHLIPPEARLVTHHDFERLAHKRTNRRWSSAKQAMFLARVVGQINGLVAVGIGYAAKALGASNGAAIAVGVAVALAGLAFTIRKIQDVEHCVEAFAPSPEGLPQGAAEPIRVTTGRPQLNLGPAVAGVANLTR